jgi:type II secretory ATPase GspE/PulE/Tfp pilus assembly ATPase PilB-like protein
MEVDERQGLTMYEGLRTLLRMDPDVLLIGEIRDADSAVVAARAALSGRLVLATIHGRDALAALEAFHYLGVPNYIIGSSTQTVIAQSLVRRLCPECSESRAPGPEEAQVFEQCELPVPTTVAHPVGCETCHGLGYQGRVGLFQILPVEKDLAQKICHGFHRQELEAHVGSEGKAAFVREGLIKVNQEVTSMEEIFSLASRQDGQ